MNLFLFSCVYMLRFCTTYPKGKKIEVQPDAPNQAGGVILYFFDMQNQEFADFIQKLDRILAILEKGILPPPPPPPQPENDLLSRRETAELLKVSLQTVQNYIDNGTLKAQRLGTRIRLKKSDILAAFGNVSPKKKRG